MPTLYIDYEGGDDNNAGTSFAVLASGVGGLTTGGAFTAATGGGAFNTAWANTQYLSIFNGSIYAVYLITAVPTNSTLTVVQISGGTALPASPIVAGQYYIGGRWKTMTGGATAVRTIPGDTIRVMASPAPTSLGTATWTGGGRPLAVNIASSTNATPIAVTTSAAHGLVTGDYVSITGHTTNTNANGVWRVGSTPSSTQFTITQMDGTNTTGNGVGGAAGNVTKVTNCIVKLGTADTQNIAMCGGLGQKPAWSVSTNVTSTQTTATGTYKEGYSAASIAVGAAFTTGKAAWMQTSASLNLSAYQQVSFWVQLSSGTYTAAGNAYLALCSDTAGNTVVHQCPIPLPGATGVWVPVTVNLGANLNTGVNSVALYIVTDEGAQTWLIDNIVACKAASAADSLSLQSLVSKSDGTGDEAWYAIQSINADTIMLANITSNSAENTAIRGYNGTTETVTTYKRDTIKTIPAALSTTVVQNIAEGGTGAGAIMTYSGGWNRTDMSTQTGYTWFDGQNGLGSGVAIAGSLNFVTIDRISACRYTTGLSMGTTSRSSITNAYVTACTTGIAMTSQGATNSVFTNTWGNNNATGFSISGSGHTITAVKTAANCTVGFNFNAAWNCAADTIITGNALTTGLQFNSALGNVVGTLTSTNGVVGVTVNNSQGNYLNGGSTSGGSTSGVSIATNNTGILYLNNFTINETTEVVTSGPGSTYVYSNRHDNTDGNNWQWQGGGTINQQTSVVDSPATTSWQMRPTNANTSATVPIKLKLGTIVCAANSLVTVTARMRRDNSGLTVRLCCPGGQISGVPNDVFGATDVVGVNAWETITLTFTPTKPGGVDIYAYAYGGTTFSGYVCNLTASQA